MARAILQTRLADGEEFLRLPRVLEITGLSRSDLYRHIDQGEFPRGRKYPNKRTSYWLLTEVRGWQEAVLEGALTA